MAAFASVRSIKGLMDVQASLFRSAMDKAFTRNMQLTSSSIELAQQAMKPINARPGDPVSAAREGDGMTSHLDAHAPAARTGAVRRVLAHMGDQRLVAELLFLEAWEERSVSGSAALLRVRQLHRAQQALLAEVRTEIMDRRHPGTVAQASQAADISSNPL